MPGCFQPGRSGVEGFGGVQDEARRVQPGIAGDIAQRVLAVVAAQVGAVALTCAELKAEDLLRELDRVLEVGRAEADVADVLQRESWSSPCPESSDPVHWAF